MALAKSAKGKPDWLQEWLGDHVAGELAVTALNAVLKSASFDESAHPRAKDGTFGQGEGGMSHEDHYAVALKARQAAARADAKGDHKTAASFREIAKDHTDKGIAKQRDAIASAKPSTPREHAKVDAMQGEVERRSRVNKSADRAATGAAFQYARRLNRQRGGSKKQERQIAEDYLKRRGHAPLKVEPTAKSATVSDDSVALALGALEDVVPEKSAPTPKKAAASKSAFPKAFVNSAQKLLPTYLFDKVHAHARSSAGGQASGTVRRHASDPEAKLNDLWERRNALAAELEGLDRAIETMPATPTEAAKAISPGFAETHVDVPLGSNGKRRPKPVKPKSKAKDSELPDVVAKGFRFDESVQLAEQALTTPLTEHDERLINAQRLVVGMDWEMRVGAAGAEDARARASRQLAQDMGYYDGKLQKNDSIRRLRGLDIDIGSGQVRELGYLGLDLYPYDYGTAIHDVGLGLPFGDTQVRSARLVNALQYMPDFAEGATPLLIEVQRVLCFGGKLLYVGRGDLMAKADWSQLPGLVLVGHEDTTPMGRQEPGDSDLHKQIFERVRVRVPRVYGCDPEWLGAEEEAPEDIYYAMLAMGAAAPVGETMADLLHPSGNRVQSQPELPGILKSAKDGDHVDVNMGAGAPVVSTDEYKKIVYAVVYAPHELDFDGEYMEAGAIEEMAHDALRAAVPIKSEHVSDPIGAHIVESYIAPVDFEIKGQDGPQHIPKGAWVIAIQFTDDKEWQKVLTGEYRGISVGGAALIEHR